MTQVFTDFTKISGTVTLDLCTFPVDQFGISRILSVQAESNDDPPLRPVFKYGPVLSPPLELSSYALDVGVDSEKRTYTVGVWTRLGNGDDFYFASKTVCCLTDANKHVPLNFVEQTALITVQFVDDNDQPVAMTDDSTIHAYTAGTIPGGMPFFRRVATTFRFAGAERKLLVRADEELYFRIIAATGGDPYSDQIRLRFDYTHMNEAGELTENPTDQPIRFAPCTEQTVKVRIPTGSLGQIRATVDLVGETPVRASRSGSSGQDLPMLRAFVPEVGTSRLAQSTPGQPHEFIAKNLLPTTLLDNNGYDAQVQLALLIDGQPELFVSPIVENIELDPGENLDLDILRDKPFVMSRAYLHGAIQFCGPPTRPGAAPMLAHIVPPQDTTEDGFPNRIHSGIRATAPGRGWALVAFDGTFDESTREYGGRYRMAVGGLNFSAAEWKRNQVILYLQHPDNAARDWFWEKLGITETRPRVCSVAHDGAPGKDDIAIGFSEVVIRFRARDGEAFYHPGISGSGSFDGIDFQGCQANYRVGVDVARGVPTNSADATDEGTIRILLPQGNYTLRPKVRSAATGTFVEFPPLELPVPAKSILDHNLPLLAPRLDRHCYTLENPLTGRVPSEDSIGRSVQVQQISFTFDDKTYTLPVPAGGWGVSPTFIIDFAEFGITPEPGSARIVIEATSEEDTQSRLDTDVVYDIAPPVITVPDEITVPANPDLACAAVVAYADQVTATDTCPGAVDIVCNPPSGAQFPVGTTPVTCTATDALGNQSTRIFNVTVQPPPIIRQPAVMIEWDARCGVLQVSEDQVNWTDIPDASNPFFAPDDHFPQKVYRVRAE